MDNNLKERIEHYREGLPPKTSRKKFSSALILLNLVIILVLVTIYKRTPTKNFSTTTLEYDNINYTVVIAKNTKTQRHLLSVTLKSLVPDMQSFNYHTSIVEIIFQSEGQVIYKTGIGKNSTHQVFKPYEIKTFEEAMNDEVILGFIDNHPQSLIPKRKTNLFGENQYLPLSTVIKINTEKPITFIVDMKYEIN